jgi:hypothetical protein
MVSIEEFSRLSTSRLARERAMLSDAVREDSAYLVFRGIAGVLTSIPINLLVTAFEVEYFLREAARAE